MSSLRGTTSVNTTATGQTTAAVPKPSGLAAGDAWTCLLHVINNTTQNSWSEVGLPTDAFLIGDANGDSDAYAKAFLVGGIASGSEGATIDFTYQDPSGAANTFSLVAVLNARSGHDAFPFERTVNESNTATGGSTTTLVRTGAGWTTNVHAGRILRNITTGKISFITSNTGDTLTLRHAMSSANANTHSYEILTLAAAVQFNATSAASVIAPAVTAIASDPTLVCYFAGADGNQSTFGDNLTVPGSMVERTEINIDSRGGWSRVAVADEAITATGSTGTRTATLGTSWQSFGASVLLREPVSGGSSPLILLRDFAVNAGQAFRI